MQNAMQNAPIESSRRPNKNDIWDVRTRKLDGETILIFKMFSNMDFLPRLALN